MPHLTIRRKTKNLEKLIKKLEKIDKQGVKTGVFIEQGEHPTAEMSYVDLAIMHEEGDGDFPPRTVRNLTLNEMKNSTVFHANIVNELKGYLFNESSLDFTLMHIGEDMQVIGENFFGEVNLPDMFYNSLNTIKMKNGRDTPLVDTGALQEAWSFKISTSDIIFNGF